MRLLVGDCVEELRELPENSVHAIVTDPPYGLEFMGKDWDKLGATVVEDPADVGGFQDGSGGNSYSRSRIRFGKQPGWRMVEWHVAWATEALRVLKPGGYALVFGGSRTYHTMAMGLELAGFEIRDQIQWLYGSGFPKALDVGKAIDQRLGDGTDEARRWDGWKTALKPAHEPIVVARKPLVGTVAENVMEHGTGAMNIGAGRIGDEGGGTNCNRRDDDGKCLGHPDRSGKAYGVTYHGPEASGGRYPANVVHDGSEEVCALLGDASRFFYCAKPSRAERNVPGFDNFHPTVKPVALMSYLAKLVTVPGGTILDPFLGSGTTGVAAKAEGFDFIGIERDREYAVIAALRIENA